MTRWGSLGLCVLGAVLVYSGGLGAWAVIVLAAMGALLAGRGTFRRVVAVVVALEGIGLLFGGTLLTILGGIAVVAGGIIAFVNSPSWPVMSSRYERAPEPERADMWTALDRGEDPTAR